MTGRRISPAVQKEYLHKRWALKMSRAQVLREMGARGPSESTAKKWDRGFHDNGQAVDAINEGGVILDEGPPSFDELVPEAQAALEDFGLFRRRYFGIVSKPWQVEAANQVVELLATPHKEFLVINCPPGSGKTRTFTHDLPAWLTCRDRAIRGLLGHNGETIAKSYVEQLRNTLERTVVLEGHAEDGTVDAEATLVEDFGGFRPPKGMGQWSRQSFVVTQPSMQATANKEATWTAFGQDSSTIGWRVDFAMWDDLVEQRSINTAEAIKKQRQWFDRVAEKRVEPGGLFVLMGQRLGANDLYRYAINKPGGDVGSVDPDDVEALDRLPRKYHHIMYPAHIDERCEQNHDPETAVPYQGHYSEPSGDCLLDPERLSWRELTAAQRTDPQEYATVYQQRDIDEDSVLVKPIWVSGGTDPTTGVYHPGCWDNDRAVGELPDGLKKPLVSICGVDPSVEAMWGIQWWVIQPETEQRWLIDLRRGRMAAPELLEWLAGPERFVGLMEDWQARSVEMGVPIGAWVIEDNAAHRYLLQYDHVDRWVRKWRTRIVPHNTNRSNKADPKMGVEARLTPIWRDGLVSLPGSSRGASRTTSIKLVDEVTTWPDANTTDLVMAQWFVEHNWRRVWRKPAGRVPPPSRPSWVRGSSRLARAG